MFSTIIATGSAVPQREVTNAELAQLVDTSDEWIVTRTGMSRRRIAVTETTSSLAAAAARRALDGAGLSPDAVDLIVAATVTPDNFTPTVSCQVQATLGCARATCFDLWAGCSGFVYGVKVADAMIRSGAVSRAIVVGAETLSRVVDWTDRGTCVLFGDGAGAVLMEASPAPGVMACVTGSDGTRGGFLRIPGLPIRNPWADATSSTSGGASGASAAEPSVISMDGQEVFRFAVGAIQWSIEEASKLAGVPIGRIRRIVPHQANNRIIDAVASRMRLPREVFYTNLQHYGNTSAASIPIALDEMNRQGLLHNGDHLALVGFGGGLMWGGAMVRWTASATRFPG
ncbi:MAG: beta-ketoacyl-ACP synthase III [Bacillota bacterium]